MEGDRKSMYGESSVFQVFQLTFCHLILPQTLQIVIIKTCLFIYLSVSSLSCSMWDLCCDMWDASLWLVGFSSCSAQA